MIKHGYSFTLKLTDEQAHKFFALSFANNSCPDDLLESFVLDLLEDKKTDDSIRAKDYVASKDYLEDDSPVFCDWLISNKYEPFVCSYLDSMEDINKLYLEYSDMYGLDTSLDSYDYKLAIDSIKYYNDNLAYFLNNKKLG